MHLDAIGIRFLNSVHMVGDWVPAPWALESRRLTPDLPSADSILFLDIVPL